MSRVEANSERGAASNRWLAKQTEWRCTAVCGRWYKPGGSITRSGDSNQTVEIVSWRQTRERVKRAGWADGVTLFAAEEDSDIISSQLLSTFPSRAVLYLLSFLIETRTAAARAAARLLGLCLWEKLFFSCSPLLFLFFFFLLLPLFAGRVHSVVVGVKTSFVCVCFPFTCRQRAG